MRKPCKVCGMIDPMRGKNARYCRSCAADQLCELCNKPHGKKAGSKYCAACFAKVPHMLYHPKEMRRVKSEKMNWQGPTYMGLTPTEMDWVKLAAFIDGEGNIGLSPRRTDTGKSLTFCGRVLVTNTDVRLAVWCEKTFGMKVYQPSRRWAGDRVKKWKPCWYACATAWKASWLLYNCLPHFLLKREQAEIVLEHQYSTRPDTFRRAQGATTPQDVLDYRMSLKDRLNELNKKGPANPMEVEVIQ